MWVPSLSFYLPAQFTHELFGIVRVLKGDDGEIWFVAKDVCDALGIRTDTLKMILDEDEVTKTDPNTVGVKVNAPHGISLINESGLYSLVLRSRKPEAKKFKKWVTGEVLPSIRKHGAKNRNILTEKSETLFDISKTLLPPIGAAAGLQ
jgi:prophage antirepressor-like protein